MPLTDELGVDLATLKVNELEEQMKGGGLPPEGLHHAALVGFREGTANSGRKFRELKFKILAGPGKNFEVKESLWNSDKAAGKSRLLVFAHRLGVYQRVGEGLVPVPGKSDFGDVLYTQCVINVKHEEREYEDKQGKKQTTTDVVLDFEGVLALDDPRCKGVPRADGAQVAAASVPGAPPPSKYAAL